MQKKLDKASGSVKKDAANKAPKAKAKGKCKSKACEPKHDAEPDEGGAAAEAPESASPAGPASAAQPRMITESGQSWEEVVP